jgi:predicted Zn-dependent peptidase
MEYFQFELPNGIRCVHRPVKGAVNYCGLAINTGSRDELPGEQGLAHFTEHLLFKGTQRRKAYQINSRLENVGGELNAFTTKEETLLHAATLRRDFPRAAELIADIAFYSTFPAHEIEREKEVVLDEINSYKDAPAERIYDDFEDRLFAGSPLGHNILGSKQAVMRFQSADIHEFRKRAYNTDQMVFSSVGPIGERRFREVCERFFGPIPCNERGFRRLAVPDVPAFRVEQKHRTFQAHCLIGGRAYSHLSPQRLPFLLLVNLLGGPFSNSLLNMALRERNGFSYTIEAGYTPLAETGVSAIYFSSDKDKTDVCIDLIFKELDKVISGKITSRQFAVSKKQFIGQLYISMENSENNMLSAGKSLLLYNRIDSLGEMIRKIEAVTPGDLVEVAREVYGGPQSFFIYK